MQYRKFSVFALFAIMIVCLIPACVAQTVTKFDSADETGEVVDLFSVGDSVWAKGIGFTAGDTFTINVVEDVDPWVTGAAIVPVTTQVSVTVPASGDFLVEVWDEAQPGKYDIVADKHGVGTLGVYDRGIDRVDNDDIGINVDSAGLMVVPEYVLGGLAAVGAAFVAFAVVKRKAIHL